MTRPNILLPSLDSLEHFLVSETMLTDSSLGFVSLCQIGQRPFASEVRFLREHWVLVSVTACLRLMYVSSYVDISLAIKDKMDVPLESFMARSIKHQIMP